MRFVLVHCDILARARVLAEFFGETHESGFLTQDTPTLELVKFYKLSVMRDKNVILLHSFESR